MWICAKAFATALLNLVSLGSVPIGSSDGYMGSDNQEFAHISELLATLVALHIALVSKEAGWAEFWIANI